ncbi:hypothetical protein EKK58_03680 [Candidatus Dependentiae bacterium]|nr:MAG: hypothetical protein EKK58_03680 [Candidatus Dependentiae bacterium]
MLNKKNIFLLLCIPYYATATIIWNNVMDPGTASALNEDVLIVGDTWLPAELININASNRDIKITMLNGPHKVYCTKQDSTSTTVVLKAVFPWKIEVEVTEDLTFIGLEGDLATPLVIQERGVSVNDEYPLIQWTVYEHKNLYFGPNDKENAGGVNLQIVCDVFYFTPRHIFKINGSPSNPHLFFSRNSSLTYLQETSDTPLRRCIEFDVSNGQPRSHFTYFKDGSGLFFESAQIFIP